MRAVAAILERLAQAPDLTTAAQCRCGQALAMIRVEMELAGSPDSRKPVSCNVVALLAPPKRPEYATRRPCPKCGATAKGSTPRESRVGMVQYWRCGCGWRVSSPVGDPVNSGSITL